MAAAMRDRSCEAGPIPLRQFATGMRSIKSSLHIRHIAVTLTCNGAPLQGTGPRALCLSQRTVQECLIVLPVERGSITHIRKACQSWTATQPLSRMHWKSLSPRIVDVESKSHDTAVLLRRFAPGAAV